MTVEILYPEYANLYGDTGNMRYLQLCLPDAAWVETPIHREPAFVSQDVSLIYMGAMSETAQEKAIERLRPHRERILSLVEQGTVFLLTGNAMEVFGEGIENEDGTRIEGLGILPIIAKRDMMHRYADAYKGRFEEMDIVGFKAQFTMSKFTKEGVGLFETAYGVGLNRECPIEGVRVGNMFGTYLLGPLLVLNPPFTRYLLGCMGVEVETLPFEDQAMEAYRRRLADFEKMA